MAPAYDEFMEKRFGRRRSISDVLKLPRFRRNRRTAALIVLFITLGFYFILRHPSPFDTQSDSVNSPSYNPWFLQYNPVLGDGHASPSTSIIKFPHLYASLSHSSAAGLRSWNRIVLFVAGDLRAASRLAGIACEMSTYNRVHVHFALVGANNISMTSFQTMNAVGDGSGCQMTFHDARPTFAREVSKDLIERAVKTAVGHMHRFLHPQVIFTDKALEEYTVSQAIQDSAQGLGVTLIQLPWNAVDDLRWMTRLDSGALKAWNLPKIEIYIRPDPHRGNLERLLRSLRDASYFGILPTRLTIEIDPDYPLHPFTQSFLQNFHWPSRDRVSIIYPILPLVTDPTLRAVHHIQSFFPIDSDTSVLFLDPNVELSPYYFHWLHYITLEYRYSAYLFSESEMLYGVSLIPPKAFMNGTAPFNANLTQTTPFLYAAPAMEGAALYFPQFWAELRLYARWRMETLWRKTEEDAKLQGVGNAAELSRENPLPTAGNDPTTPVDIVPEPTSITTPVNMMPEPISPAITQKPLQQPPNPQPHLPDLHSDPIHSPMPRPQVKRSLSPPPLTHNLTLPLPSPLPAELTSTWLLLVAELSFSRASLMLYPFPSIFNVLALHHQEIPSKNLYDHTTNPERRLMTTNAILELLPNGELPEFSSLEQRNLKGERVGSGEGELETQAVMYRMQATRECALSWYDGDWGFCERMRVVEDLDSG